MFRRLDGSLIRKIEGMHQPNDVCVDDVGFIFVTEMRSKAVLMFG